MIGLDYVAAGLGITAFTLIRRKRWYGWIVTMVSQCLYSYLMWPALKGMVFLFAFNFCNAALALYQWRRAEVRVNKTAAHGVGSA